MKALVLYPYPRRTDGQSLQGYYMAKGLRELGVDVMECDRLDDREKVLIYEHFKPDFVVGVGFWADAPALISHPLAHGMRPVPWFNADGWVANYHSVLNSLPLLVATSNWVKSTYIRDGVDGKNIRTCGIGFEPAVFYPVEDEDARRKKKRTSLGVADDEVMLLTAGGDVTSKGAQEMFRALARLDPALRWKYVLKTLNTFSAVNHGNEEEALIAELGLDPSRIVYVRDDYSPEQMADLLRACDVYAGPSRLEGFGMIQVEAMACGKPVISINIGGPQETIVHGVTGFLADVASEVKLEREWAYPSMGFDRKMQIEFPIPKTFAYRADVAQLADFTSQLITNRMLREKMGVAAASHALENYHYKIVAKKMLDLVKENLGIE